jgi:SAM-dependent methyltransferase
MIEIPDTTKAYEFENSFYLTCKPSRIGKLLAHYELYQIASEVAGTIVEFWIFKGPSFSRFAMFRSLFEHEETRSILGFDIFGKFPETQFEDDKPALKKFIESAGDQSISEDQLIEVLRAKRCDQNVELVAGDICKTLPEYLKNKPHTRFSLIHLDVDIYEPSACVIENAFPLLAVGGVLVLDDYGIFPGATKAVDDYFKDRPEKIRKFSFSNAPCYVIKETH